MHECRGQANHTILAKWLQGVDLRLAEELGNHLECTSTSCRFLEAKANCRTVLVILSIGIEISHIPLEEGT